MDKERIGDAEIIRWKKGPSTFRACPALGARLMDWTIEVTGQKRSVIHWPEDADWSRPAKIRGGNPVLFPFSARTFDGSEIGFWKADDGIRRPMQQHGYARDGQFKLIDLSEDGFRARFLPSEDANEAYPFQYDFDVVYQFDDLGMTVDYELTNHMDKPIPWSAGHHFYFYLPWHEGAGRKDYRVQIPAKKAFHHAEDGRLVAVKGFDQETRFHEADLVDRIHTRLTSNEVRFGPLNGEEDICIKVGTANVPEAWTAVVTWTMAEDSPFYCVEPWMGPPNAPSHKNGLHYVNPGQTQRFTNRLELS